MLELGRACWEQLISAALGFNREAQEGTWNGPKAFSLYVWQLVRKPTCSLSLGPGLSQDLEAGEHVERESQGEGCIALDDLASDDISCHFSKRYWSQQ